MVDPQTPDFSPETNEGGNTDSVMVRTFIWDGENIARQTDREYTHNPQQYGELISQGGDPGTYFHHGVYPERRRGNALGSTERLTDTNEGVSASYLYKAFGEQSVLSGSHANPFTWVGRLGYYRQGDLATVVVVDPSGRQGYRGPRRRPEPVEAPTATVARRYGPGRFHRPHPPEPPEPPEPLEPEEPEEEEPLGGDGGVAPTGEGLACRMRAPWQKNKKAYGHSYRWVCQCPNQEHWECSFPTGWGPPKAGRTKTGNKFVKDLWPSDCRCSCPDSCGGTVNMRRREWRGDSDELVSEVERQKEVKGKCVDDPWCGPDITHALAHILGKVREKYQELESNDPSRLHRACRAIDPVWLPGDYDNPIHHLQHALHDAWDIQELRTGEFDNYQDQCAIGDCERTVQVGKKGDCFTDNAVNYVLFGLIANLCDRSSLWTMTMAATKIVKTTRPSAWLSAVRWAMAGWGNYPTGADEPPEERRKCRRCRLSVPVGSLTAEWDYMSIW